MTGTYTAAVLETIGQPLVLRSLPIPKARTGSAIIKVLATALSPNIKAVLAGVFGLVTPRTPVVPGFSTIGRIHSVGPDATCLKPGQLIWHDFFTQSRDNPDDSILAGFMGGNQQLEETWNNNTLAEYAEVPLERIWTLNEDLLCKTKGYSFTDLSYLGTVGIPLVGLLDMGVRPGDSVIVAPATGTFGGSAVPAALSLGAKVIACGRNAETLARMTDAFGASDRFVIVVMTGKVNEDTAAIKAAAGGKGADYYIDFIPPRAVGTTHILSCLGALRNRGRASFMGAIFGNIEIPYFLVMLKNIRIEGRYMFDRGHGEQAVKLLETGHLVVGDRPMGGTKMHGFKLKNIHQAIDAAAEYSGWGNMVVLEP
ncbi:uncharacterized protein Z518_00375 [Rhinocladiella mackenziei CBS 650.93]|uniref:Alcohol dehydrogenase-like C-terminal domain-containing protein n=1 Tax=Rhinocladiella mackenziei CBS 650.93 TaxID=1442369 RepID=A0A0D2J0S7_9EURO|nr:uncharacterized protein Z518_00375 [Rhinocladiella mackenziei CBS 650.93]KIX09296.1 hypothetical protein Z518_00375 [Rhinocladiella mackenziei CBS 650.93]